ncbi:MAG: zinc ribbon domain-containing protein, partial [Oscillospiraceae bacterium]|nr:zinc ribbon domain-containing protein [Oscillospiraceae bacterium]
MFCTSCGHDRTTGNMFCIKCGVRFEQESNIAPQHEEITQNLQLDRSAKIVAIAEETFEFDESVSVDQIEIIEQITTKEQPIEDNNNTSPPPKPSIMKIITKIILTVLLCIFGIVAFIALSLLLMLRQINITELINFESLPQLEFILLMLLTNYAIIASIVLYVIYLFNLFLLHKKNIKIFLLSYGITLALVGLIYFAISLYIDQFSGLIAEIEQYIIIFSNLVPYLIVLELILIVLGGILLVSFFLIKSRKKNKLIKTTTPKVKRIWFNTGVITNGALSVTLLVLALLFIFNIDSISAKELIILDEPEYDDNPTVIEVLNYEYHDYIEIIKQTPKYSIVVNGNLYVITIDNPSKEIRDLSIGDTFIFEPTIQNPEGLAGHITSIARADTKVTIAARAPETLDEIFEEFELEGDINLLADSNEIILDEELVDLEGIEFGRNPTRLFEARFNNTTICGITLNGRLTM